MGDNRIGMIDTKAGHRETLAKEREARFQLANAALLWLWHEENPAPQGLSAAQPAVGCGAREAREKEITRLATIEECALVAEAQKQRFLSSEYASNQPYGSLCERFACDEVANAIRALAIPSTGEGTAA